MTVEGAKAILKMNGYYVDNLWQISDVQGKFECDDGDAYEVLDSVLQSERIIIEVHESIDLEAEYMELTPKEEEE